MVLSNIFIFIMILVGLGFLQAYLSNKNSRYPGLILPIVFFWISIFVVIKAILEVKTIGVITLFISFIIYNIPTAVLLLIYFMCRDGIKKKKQLDKMNIQDL